LSKITVMIPVYNTERFLPRCLDSLLAQTFTDFEILLIDDGSTDNSLYVCKQYASTDKRIRVLQTEHIGVGGVRNLGLDNAKGKYIMFCDSDDYVEPEWISELYYAIEKHPGALCNCEYALSRPSQGKIEIQSLPGITKSQIIEKRGFFGLLHCGRIMQIWTRIYRMDIIQNNKLKFRTDLIAGEDAVFNCDYLNFCNEFYYIKKCLYYWTDNDVESITRSFQPYYYDTMRVIFSARKQHVAPEFLQPFYDLSFKGFMICLDYIWDVDNKECYQSKLRQSKKMFRDSIFQETVKNVSTKACSRKKRLILRTGNYSLYRLLSRLSKLVHSRRNDY